MIQSAFPFIFDSFKHFLKFEVANKFTFKHLICV